MRNLTAATIFAAAFGSAPAGAEPIVVRSGEHETFTRIVLPLPEDAIWQLQNEPGNSQVILANHDAGFDLSLAFEIIPRTRLSAMLAQDSVLELQLACDCPVTAFVEQGDFLVIDIGDGGDLPFAERPAVQPPQELVTTAPPVSEFSSGQLLWRQDRPEQEVQSPVEVPATEPVAESLPDDQIAEPDLVLETQTRLLEAFADAASRGVLDPVQPLPEPAQEVEINEPEVDIFDSSEQFDDEALAATGNIRVTNSKDIPHDNTLADLALSGATCLDPKRVDVGSWSTDQPFNSQLGVLHRELYDEVGEIETEKVVELTRFYLHYGFGAEARQALSLVPDLTLRFPELFDLANILEYGFAKNPRSLHRFADCNSDVSLWAFLAAEDFPNDNAVDTMAVLRALQNLPSHLRYIFGPVVSEKLLERGEAESANLALRSFETLLEHSGKPPKIAQAQAKLMTGDNKEAKADFGEIINEDTPDAPEALIRLIQKLVDDDQPVPADIALLAESFSFELQNTQLGDEMLRASVLASTQSGQFEKSFAILEQQEIPFEQETRMELTSHLFAEVTDKTTDAEFVSTYFTRFPPLSQFVSNGVKVGLADRLLAMGFTDEADAISSSFPTGYVADDLRVLRAGILLDQQQYQDALKQLEGLEDGDTAELRAEILERLGNNEDAARLFDAADMPERAVSSRWLSSNWSTLVDEKTPVFGPISEITNEDPMLIDVDDRMIANAQAALSESADVRDTLEQALQALEVTEE
ncbi:MAG: hypothetical protein AAF999_01530 [Pseudomonadota bacterium]